MGPAASADHARRSDHGLLAPRTGPAARQRGAQAGCSRARRHAGAGGARLVIAAGRRHRHSESGEPCPRRRQPRRRRHCADAGGTRGARAGFSAAAPENAVGHALNGLVSGPRIAGKSSKPAKNTGGGMTVGLLLRHLVRRGTLRVIDPAGKTRVYSGAPGPTETIRLHDRQIKRQLLFNPRLMLGEAYMDGRLTLEDGASLYDLLDFLGTNISLAPKTALTPLYN